MRSTRILADNFRHHGPATQSSHPRGTVAAAAGDGRNVVLVWLFDHRGGYALLVIDAATGESREFPVPFPPGDDCPYASLLSSRNCFYTHFNGYFVEFDVNAMEYTFCHQTAPRMAMGLTEDDTGVIWSSTYPQSGLASYDPENGEFKDYGHLYKQNWRQYPTTLATDDTGWVYFGVGTTLCQVIAFDRKSESATAVLAEDERSRGSASVYRDLNGKVYALPPTGTPWPGDNPDAETWYELYRGARKTVPRRERHEKHYIAGDAGHVHPHFPDGSEILECSLVDRVLSVQDPDGNRSPDVSFDYTSEGAHIMGVAAAPDGTICGGTFFPRRTFSYRPETDAWIERESFGQWNTVGRQGDRFFVGGYGSGALLEWDPYKPWVTTEKENPASNPFFHRTCTPTMHRPHKLLVHPDGKTLVVAGTPGYGYTGGGLLIWNCERRNGTLLEHTDLLPDHSTASLAALSGRKLLGGTTTSPGTGGEQKAAEAELYILDMETRDLEWRQVLFPGAQEYTDLCMGRDGFAYGFVDRARFFVFCPHRREVIHQEETDRTFGPTAHQQGPRVFVTAPDGAVHVLFEKGIARIESGTFALENFVSSPVPISNGGDWLDRRIYFTSDSHLYSWEIP
ncbi:MAG: hypothetical protein OXH06_10280 [Gemmatimonadetes bacterium]|nr:hypothetical protein [Gemmatimonadota bacterium]